MKSYPYQILGATEREGSLFFMLDSLLRSRIDTGEETLDDEDVNVYLASLLHSFLDRSFEVECGGVLSRHETDIFALAETGDDLRMRYRVYKGNADYALMISGVFDSRCSRGRTEPWKDEVVTERGKQFYRFASDCHTRLSRKKTGIADVLEKLSERFEMYVKILSHMRVAYFNLVRRLSDGEMYHLQRAVQEVQEGVEEQVETNGLDRFLDAYGSWLRTGTETDRGRVNRLGEELGKADPAFRFSGI